MLSAWGLVQKPRDFGGDIDENMGLSDIIEYHLEIVI